MAYRRPYTPTERRERDRQFRSMRAAGHSQSYAFKELKLAPSTARRWRSRDLETNDNVALAWGGTSWGG